MAGRLLIPGWARALDSDGDPISARISLFLTGTDDLAPVYSNEALTIPLQNPVESNSAGRFPAIWADDAATYDWSVEAPYGSPGSPFTGIGLTTALAADVLAAEAAEAAATEAEANAAQTAADLAAIQAIEAEGSTAPAIAGKADRDGSNILGAQQLAFRTAIGADLAANVNYTAIGTGGQTRATQTVLRERPVTVLDYYDAGDGADYGPAFTRALNAAANVFWPNDGVSRTVSTAVDVTATGPKTVDFQGAPVTFAATAEIACPIIADVGVSLSSNAARFGNTVVLNTVANIQSGDLLHIQSDATPFTDYPDTKQDLIAIRSISGSTLTLAEGLNYAWATSETLTISIFRPHRITILNPNIYSPQVDGATVATYALRITGGQATVRGGSLSGSPTFTPFSNFYRAGIQFYHCFGVVVDDVSSANLSYPFGAYGGTRNVQETNTRSRYCRHGIVDMGQSASGYRGSGHQGSDNFITVSAHPSFDVNVTNLTAIRDQFLPAMRCVGGSLRNVRVLHTDNSVDATQIHNIVPTASFADLYDRADFTIDGLTLDNPTRSVLDLKLVYGRTVTVARFSGYDVELGSAITNPAIIKPLALTGGKTGPASTGLKKATQIADASLLDAYLEGGAYKINPRRSSVLQSNKTLYARGQIFRKATAGTYTVTIHTNAFSGLVTATYLVGVLKLRASLQHESTGFFSSILGTYPFAVTDSSVVFPTTSNPVGVATTGSGGADVTLAVSAPAFSNAGTGGDSFVQISIAVDSSVGVSNPAYELTYELELTETFAA